VAVVRTSREERRPNLMDGFPGVIASDDAFGINSDGKDGDGNDHTQ